MALFRSRPAFAADVLACDDIPVEPFTEARLRSECFSVLQPTERRADATIELLNDHNEPGLAVIVEVQLRPDPKKRTTWPTYVCRLYEDVGCPIALLVLCADDTTARWAATPIPLGPPGSQITPIPIGPRHIPRLTSATDPAASPEMATLSAITHGSRPGGYDVIDTMDIVFSRTDPTLARDYTEFVLGLLKTHARTYLEKLMATMTHEYHSEFTEKFVRKGLAKGKAEGEATGLAKGKAESVLQIIDARDIPTDARHRHQILSCTDPDRLSTWLRRALDATTIDEILTD
ncbi:hypothetical protein STSO111631_22380 [Stackebrandtia soli]